MTARMLVTGGAGFIGSNFIRYTLAHRPEYRIAVLDALTDQTYARNLQEVAGRIDFHHGDVSEQCTVDRLIDRLGIDIVVHFAAESHNDHAHVYPERFARTNIIGTLTLLENARRTGVRLHHVSTDEVFGELPLGSDELFDLSSPIRPLNYYSSSKASSEHFVRAAWKQFRIPVTLSNSTNNYGPFQHVEKVIPRQITDVLRGVRPRVHGSGRNVRDWIHVDDHCSAIHAVLDRGQHGETYLVGARNELSNIDLVREINSAMEMPDDWFEYTADRPHNDLRYAVDASRTREECGWEPVRTDFRAELMKVIAWYQENVAWWSAMKDESERNYQRLGR